MVRLTFLILASMALVAVVILGFRGRSSTMPPLQAFDDMVEQAKYKAQAQSAFFADGRTMRTPPAGTVAWGHAVRSREESLVRRDEDYFKLTSFPSHIKLDRSVLVRGQQQYNTFCVVCHGGTGSGDGITRQYGMLTVPSYHSEQLRKLAVGDIYRTITLGKGTMGSYGDRLTPEDRWAVVAYVRTLQRALDGRLEDVPAERRREVLP